MKIIKQTLKYNVFHLGVGECKPVKLELEIPSILTEEGDIAKVTARVPSQNILACGTSILLSWHRAELDIRRSMVTAVSRVFHDFQKEVMKDELSSEHEILQKYLESKKLFDSSRKVSWEENSYLASSESDWYECCAVQVSELKDAYVAAEAGIEIQVATTITKPMVQNNQEHTGYEVILL